MAISFIRTVILFLLIVIALRTMGKRQLGELEPTEFVVSILISDLATQPLQNLGTPLIYGIVPVLTILCCQVIISGLEVKSIRFRTLMCGKPSIVISDGGIIQSEMRKNRVTIDELVVELRKHAVTDISTVKHAIIETDGTLSVLLKAEASPVTPKQLKMPVPTAGFPVIVINDGRVLDNNLNVLGLDSVWLDRELQSQNIFDPAEVFIMSVDSLGNTYFAKKEAAQN